MYRPRSQHKLFGGFVFYCSAVLGRFTLRYHFSFPCVLRASSDDPGRSPKSANTPPPPTPSPSSGVSSDLASLASQRHAAAPQPLLSSPRSAHLPAHRHAPSRRCWGLRPLRAPRQHTDPPTQALPLCTFSALGLGLGQRNLRDTPLTCDSGPAAGGLQAHRSPRLRADPHT